MANSKKTSKKNAIWMNAQSVLRCDDSIPSTRTPLSTRSPSLPEKAFRSLNKKTKRMPSFRKRSKFAYKNRDCIRSTWLSRYSWALYIPLNGPFLSFPDHDKTFLLHMSPHLTALAFTSFLFKQIKTGRLSSKVRSSLPARCARDIRSRSFNTTRKDPKVGLWLSWWRC